MMSVAGSSPVSPAQVERHFSTTYRPTEHGGQMHLSAGVLVLWGPPQPCSPGGCMYRRLADDWKGFADGWQQLP